MTYEESLIGKTARAALEVMNTTLPRTIKSTKMREPETGAWGHSEDGKILYGDVIGNYRLVKGAKKNKALDTCTVKHVKIDQYYAYIGIETPNGEEKFLDVTFCLNVKRVKEPAPEPKAEEKVEEKAEEKVEQKIAEPKTEDYAEILTRPENAYYLKMAQMMKERGELNDRRAIKAVCSMFDRPKLMKLAIMQVQRM